MQALLEKITQAIALYDNRGRLNSHAERQLAKTPLYQEILEATSFLPNDAPFKERLYYIESGLTQQKRCRVCNNAIAYHKTFCAAACASQDPDVAKTREDTIKKRYGGRQAITKKAQATKAARHGDPHYTNRDKATQTMLEKYGTSHYTNRDKAAQTMLERYGSKGTLGSKMLADKVAATKAERYSDPHYTNRDKAAQTMLERYGGHYSTTAEFREMVAQKNREQSLSEEANAILSSPSKFAALAAGKSQREIAHLLQVNDTTILKYARQYQVKHDLVSIQSFWEERVKRLLQDLKVNFEENTRKVINPLELDFWLPDYNVAIELNGNYWHSELGGGKDKNYHFDKWMKCREQGIDLYSWFEDELIQNFEIVEKKIRYIVNHPTVTVGARCCKIGDVDYQTEVAFLKAHHIQGQQGSRNKTIGAYHNGNLVAVFSWQLRKKYLEITRFATDTEASYPGLFSKMMAAMIRELDYCGPVVSFSNNGHSNGGVYRAAGFKIDKILGPAYWYTRDYRTRENRQQYMKAKIAKKFNIDMTNKTEWQAMQELGYDRIWDSGKIKWVFEQPPA